MPLELMLPAMPLSHPTATSALHGDCDGDGGAGDCAPAGAALSITTSAALAAAFQVIGVIVLAPPSTAADRGEQLPHRAGIARRRRYRADSASGAPRDHDMR